MSYPSIFTKQTKISAHLLEVKNYLTKRGRLSDSLGNNTKDFNSKRGSLLKTSDLIICNRRLFYFSYLDSGSHVDSSCL